MRTPVVYVFSAILGLMWAAQAIYTYKGWQSEKQDGGSQ
jgi:hypothetical protein